MSMAMKYAMKKRMAKGGGACSDCAAGNCMAHGGEVKKDSALDDKYWDGSFKLPHHTHRKKVEDAARAKQKAREDESNEASKRRMDPVYKAEGGDVTDDDLVMRIMKKRYAHGGEVEPLADFESNDFDVMDKEPAEEFDYSGANSGDELGDKDEDESDDVVSRAMKARKKKSA